MKISRQLLGLETLSRLNYKLTVSQLLFMCHMFQMACLFVTKEFFAFQKLLSKHDYYIIVKPHGQDPVPCGNVVTEDVIEWTRFISGQNNPDGQGFARELRDLRGGQNGQETGLGGGQGGGQEIHQGVADLESVLGRGQVLGQDLGQGLGQEPVMEHGQRVAQGRDKDLRQGGAKEPGLGHGQGHGQKAGQKAIQMRGLDRQDSDIAGISGVGNTDNIRGAADHRGGDDTDMSSRDNGGGGDRSEVSRSADAGPDQLPAAVVSDAAPVPTTPQQQENVSVANQNGRSPPSNPTITPAFNKKVCALITGCLNNLGIMNMAVVSLFWDF